MMKNAINIKHFVIFLRLCEIYLHNKIEWNLRDFVKFVHSSGFVDYKDFSHKNISSIVDGAL